MHPAIHAKRIGPTLTPDRSRVLMRPFYPVNDDIARRIFASVSALTEEKAAETLRRTLGEFEDRHENVERTFRRRYDEIARRLATPADLTPTRQALIGAYFCHEYSPESAALFNPSIVAHPDQSGLPEGALRFMLSLRATGEGHISSITFRSGAISALHRITLTPPAPYSAEPAPESAQESAFSVSFDPDSLASQRVLFPLTPGQSNGIEDARFVRFQNEDGTFEYFATYTAFDGRNTQSQLLRTKDFINFTFIPLQGPGIANKGMALFPRKIDGKFAMLSRQDDQNIFIMRSDRIDYWDAPAPLLQPRFAWEQIKIGTCSSPIETPAGWLTLSHGVGPMRKYCIGAFLLDLKDPTKVLGRLREPLLEPNEAEREGYVPNVVYSCGALLHGGELVIPYAMSDYASSFATASLAPLLAAMVPDGDIRSDRDR